MSAESVLRTALRTSMNRHWLARLVIGTWSLQIPLVALMAPESLAGRALAAAGEIGLLMMILLALLASLALVDSAANDLLPGSWAQVLMHHRHVGFMALAICLVITGGGIASITKTPVMLVSFLLPAAFCVAATYLDLYSRHGRGRS